MNSEAKSMSAIPREQITGVVLAGGLSRRMDTHGAGTDKGLLVLGHQPMVRQVIDRLAPQVGHLLLNANRNLPDWQAFGLPVVADRIEGFAGPLAGLHAAMSCSTTPWIVTVPCDSPFLPTDLVQRLADAVIDAWTGQLRTVEVPFADEDAFVNINTPQDLQQHASRPSP